MRIVKKYLYGGGSPMLAAVGARQATGDTSDINQLAYMTPGLGTYLTFKDGNKGLGTISLIGDLLSLGSIGAGAKLYRNMKKAVQTAERAKEAYYKGYGTLAKAANYTDEAGLAAKSAKLMVSQAAKEGKPLSWINAYQKEANRTTDNYVNALQEQANAERTLYGNTTIPREALEGRGPVFNSYEAPRGMLGYEVDLSGGPFTTSYSGLAGKAQAAGLEATIANRWLEGLSPALSVGLFASPYTHYLVVDAYNKNETY